MAAGKINGLNVFTFHRYVGVIIFSWVLDNVQQLHAVYIHVFRFIQRSHFCRLFPIFPPLPSSYSHGCVFFPSISLSLMCFLCEWKTERSYSSAGHQTFNIMWCFGEQRKESETEEKARERKGEGMTTWETKTDMEKTWEGEKEDRQWGSLTKKGADRESKTEERHTQRQTKRA